MNFPDYCNTIYLIIFLKICMNLQRNISVHVSSIMKCVLILEFKMYLLICLQA